MNPCIRATPRERARERTTLRPKQGESNPTRNSKAQGVETPRTPTRLYLVTPPMTEAAELAANLAPALGVADVAAVLVPLAQAPDSTLLEQIKTLAPVVQSQGIALVLAGYPHLVAPSGADGAHLTGFAAFKSALATLKPRFIAGAGDLNTRHDAMLAAEAGADYVMFGEPDASGRRPSFTAVTERVSWWSELFEIPCVGYADSLDEVSELAVAGADFVAIGEFVFAAFFFQNQQDKNSQKAAAKGKRAPLDALPGGGNLRRLARSRRRHVGFAPDGNCVVIKAADANPARKVEKRIVGVIERENPLDAISIGVPEDCMQRVHASLPVVACGGELSAPIHHELGQHSA